MMQGRHIQAGRSVSTSSTVSFGALLIVLLMAVGGDTAAQEPVASGSTRTAAVIENLTITPTILNEDRRILVRHPRDYYAK